MKKLESGFSAVEGLLIFIIVGIIGGTGWYVMQANKKTDDTLSSAGLGTAAQAAKKKQTTTPQATDPTVNWIAYSSKAGKYSLKYPSTWATSPVTASSCGADDNLLLLGGDANSVGRYCSDGSGEINISSGGHGCFPLPDDDFANVTHENITTSGVQGYKYTGVAKDNSNFGISLPVGTKVVLYCFRANGDVTYQAEYNQEPNYPDVLTDFNLMVTKTLQFHS
jgi:hypothetical protein